MIYFKYKDIPKEYLKSIQAFNCETKCDYTINLNQNAEDQHGLVINKKEAYITVSDKENLIRILRLNKFRSPRIIVPGNKTNFPIISRKFEHKDGTDIKLIDSLDECLSKEADYYQRYINFSKEYIVHVCNLKLIRIEEKYIDEEQDTDDITIRTKAYGYKTHEISITKFSTTMQAKLLNIATRAISVVGLDMGYLNIGLGENNQFYVIDIDANILNLDKDTFNSYLIELEKMIDQFEIIDSIGHDVTIGCDPELLLKDKVNNTLIPASLLMDNKSQIGLDSRTIEASKQYYPILEIRPKENKNPLEVYNTIKTIMHNLGDIVHYENIGVYSGSTPITNYWLGGHIHFGCKPNSKLIRSFDNYLAIPLMHISKTSTLRQRYKFYGFLSYFRLKTHGGFEYCTLSSWLVDKNIIKGVLSLAKLISIEYLNLQSNYLQTYQDYKSYYSVKKDYFNDSLIQIMNEIKQTSSYKDYKPYIDYIFDLIIQGKEWNEDRDLKEIFDLPSSNNKYQLDNIIYIPKSKRHLYHLKVHDTIIVMFGQQKYELTVLPFDDYSPNKKALVSFSSDIYNNYKISNKIQFDLFKVKKDVYRCGPIIGIHCDKNFHRLGPFGKQSLLFRRFIKLGLKKGIFIYVFSLDNINYEKNYVSAMSYNFELENWYESRLPLPDVIYDRGLNIVEEIYGKTATKFKEYYFNNNLSSINDFKTINVVSNKLKTTELLKNDPQTIKYLPETKTFSEKHLYNMINKYPLLYCKLIDGSLGSLIYCIKKMDDGKYTIIHRDRENKNIEETVNIEGLYLKMKSMMKDDHEHEYNYIVQEGLKFVKYKERSYELRILMVKNFKGVWTRVAMVGRVRTSNRNFLGRADHEKRSSSLLKKTFGKHEPIVRDQIYTLINDVLRVVKNNNLDAGELTIDIGITKDLDVYIIELNSKPDTLLSYIGAFKLRNLYINRLLDYSKYLMDK